MTGFGAAPPLIFAVPSSPDELELDRFVESTSNPPRDDDDGNCAPLLEFAWKDADEGVRFAAGGGFVSLFKLVPNFFFGSVDEEEEVGNE